MKFTALLILVLAALVIACGCLWKVGSVAKVSRSVADPLPVDKDQGTRDDINNPLAYNAAGPLGGPRPLPIVTCEYELGNRVY
jgi:hypothetical protein